MTEGGLHQADLARKLKVSRAGFTQVIKLVDLDPRVMETIVAPGDPLPKPVIAERDLRPFVDLPLDEQRTKVRQVVQRAKERLKLTAQRAREGGGVAPRASGGPAEEGLAVGGRALGVGAGDGKRGAGEGRVPAEVVCEP